MYDFFVTIPRCYKDVYVNSFFPRTDRLWKSLPIEYFPLNCDLNSFKSRIKRHILADTFYLKVHLFLVTPYLVVAFEPYKAQIPITKSKQNLTVTKYSILGLELAIRNRVS